MPLHPRRLIFALPLAEAAIHPAVLDFSQTHAGQQRLGAVLYLVYDDLKAEITALPRKHVECTEIQEAVGKQRDHPAARQAIGLYQPRHDTALNLNSK